MSTRLLVTLRSGLRCPPTPDDVAIFDGENVYCSFAESGEYTLVGTHTANLIQKNGNLVFLTSGNGVSIPARAMSAVSKEPLVVD